VRQVEFDDSLHNSYTRFRLYGPGVDMPLAIEEVDPVPPSLGIIWTLTDHQGTVRDVAGHWVDETFRVEHVQYTAFGVPAIPGGLPGAVRTFYAGRDLDRFTGLYNNRARWYDPASGRFLSEDPIGFAAGDANLYRYCGNSPTNATDPTGEWIDRVVGAVVGAIHGALDVYAANPDASFWEYLTGAGLGALSGAVNPMGEFISAGGAILGGIIDASTGGSFFGEGFQAGGLIGGLAGGGYAAGKAAFAKVGGKAAGWAAARAGFSAGAKTFGIEGTGAAIGFGYGMYSTGGDFQTSLMYANWGQMAPNAAKALARGGAGLYRKFGGSKSRFNAKADHLAEALGPARLSHPEEYQATLQHIDDLGGDVSFRTGQYGYSASAGRAGRVILDPDSSIGAVRHEFGHLLDDAVQGYPGYTFYRRNPSLKWKSELRSYLGEISLAREIGRQDIARKLIQDAKEEYFGIFGKRR